MKSSDLSSGFIGISSFSIPYTENSITTTSTSTNIESTITSTQPIIINNIQYFTYEEVKKHNKKDDFWTVYRDKVYDLTIFWREHPGGDIILEAAGKDMTILFDDIGHSGHAEILLKKYYIGEILLK